MAKFFTPSKLSENIRETPEGFLLCLGVPIARTGWQQYADGETPLEVGEDGTVWVYRDAKEVFRPQTIASFQAKSVTVKHPENFVEPSNWKELTYGSAQNVRRHDEKDEDGEEILMADLLITDDVAIGLVRNGLREVSCGYEAEYEQTGEGEGRQFNIVGNHIALVEEGRAGSAYAINDHKGKVLMDVLKELAEKIKGLGKTVDEAVTVTSKKAKPAKVKDADKEEPVKEDKEKAKDADMYDELVKAVKDLGEKVEGMKASKDADKEDAEKEEPAKDEDESEDEDSEAESESEDDDGEEMKMEERLKAVEAALAKLLKKESAEGEASDDDEDLSGGESEDEEAEDEEKQKEKTGDAARAEILSPGIKVSKGQDLKKEALKAAFGTKDGREVISTLTGSKKLVLDSKEKIATLFIAASEVLKTKRGTGLEKTKDASAFEVGESKAEPMTAEKMNELNAALWARK